MQEKLSARKVAEARTLAEGRALANNTEVCDELDVVARMMGYRGWRRMITVYRSQKEEVCA